MSIFSLCQTKFHVEIERDSVCFSFSLSFLIGSSQQHAGPIYCSVLYNLIFFFFDKLMAAVISTGHGSIIVSQISCFCLKSLGW